MTEPRREAELPWARWPLAVRIALAVVFGAMALLMAATLAGSRGFVPGLVIGLFWGALEVFVIVFPTTMQRWARHQPAFPAVLTFGLLLYAVLVFTTIRTSIAVLLAIAVAVLVGLSQLPKRRRIVQPPTPQRGRRHS
jgi:hypothetical protein